MLLASASSEMVNSVTLAGHWSLVSKPFGASFIDNTLWLVIPGDTDSAISNGIHRWQLPPPSATTSCASWGSQTQTLMTRRPNEPGPGIPMPTQTLLLFQLYPNQTTSPHIFPPPPHHHHHVTAGFPHNPYNGVICNDVVAASGVFTTKELWKFAKCEFEKERKNNYF